jgi:hypothetical protein
MEVDAAQYAAMSMEMLKTKSFLKLYDGGFPYLDKPPLLIWLSSFSFYLFGISDFTYRLPSFLGTILAVYSTYKLARQWYNKDIANWSALILASCQAFFLFNNDVKTDDLLTCWTIFSIWQLSSFTRNQKISSLIFGATGVALAMLSKGPIGLILPAAAIGTDLLLKRDWHKIFNIKWLIAVPIVLVILSPYLIGLFEQWGWHGIRFFFWTQSFGRITGESEWKNDSTPLFFTHTFLWSFLPWTICAMYALFLSGKELVRSGFKLKDNEEGMTISGFVLIFIALSMSRYKLPHYIFILFPLAAIFTARWIYAIFEDNLFGSHILAVIQKLIYCLAGIAILFILLSVFMPVSWFLFAVITFMIICSLGISLFGKSAFAGIIIPGVLSTAAVNIGLNFGFYPPLLRYQASNVAGKFIDDHKIPEDQFYYYNEAGGHSLNYYSRRINKPLYSGELKDELKKHDIWLYVNDEDMKDVSSYPLADHTLISNQQMDKYPIQQLSINFLNADTRQKTLQKVHLLHIAKTK